MMILTGAPSFLVVFYLLISVSRIRQSATLDCYTCTGFFNMAGEDSNPGCGLITNAEIATNCTSCSFGVTSTDSGQFLQGLTVYTRRCVTYGAVKNYSYNTCYSQNGPQESCSCNSDLCNNIDIKLEGTLDCYYCTSASFFDTGCGPNINTNSSYVYVMKKCFSCATLYLSPAIASVSSYTRSGSRFAVQSLNSFTNSCQSVYGSSATAVCTCNSSLCNEGQVGPVNNTNQDGSGGTTSQIGSGGTTIQSGSGGTTSQSGSGDTTSQNGSGGTVSKSVSASTTNQNGSGGGTTQNVQEGATTQSIQGVGATTQNVQGGATTQNGQGGGATTQYVQGGATTQNIQGVGATTQNVPGGATTQNGLGGSATTQYVHGGATTQSGQGNITTQNVQGVNTQTTQGGSSTQLGNGASTSKEKRSLTAYLSLVAFVLVYI